ncbi:hypothetical protein SBRCBS47491_004654 [Sporothrix bragantina]|uniref:MARVEL domain-containing protein n=1 Tax=Sporothrix bragantina TaxID=671064 RepID=A0ABP0BQC7_9PEZI
MSAIHNTALNIASNRPLDLGLRVLQFVFALVVIGTTSYSIHAFKPYDVVNHFSFGTFKDHVGVPNAWGFLLFCAVWTVFVVFLVLAASRFYGYGMLGYVRVFVEVIALLSWFAGFIAVAVNISGSNGYCPAEEKGCAPLQVATAFGALEWALFVVTTTVTCSLVFGKKREDGEKVEAGANGNPVDTTRPPSSGVMDKV